NKLLRVRESEAGLDGDVTAHEPVAINFFQEGLARTLSRVAAPEHLIDRAADGQIARRERIRLQMPQLKAIDILLPRQTMADKNAVRRPECQWERAEQPQIGVVNLRPLLRAIGLDPPLLENGVQVAVLFHHEAIAPLRNLVVAHQHVDLPRELKLEGRE